MLYKSTIKSSFGEYVRFFSPTYIIEPNTSPPNKVYTHRFHAFRPWKLPIFEFSGRENCVFMVDLFLGTSKLSPHNGVPLRHFLAPVKGQGTAKKRRFTATAWKFNPLKWLQKDPGLSLPTYNHQFFSTEVHQSAVFKANFMQYSKLV